MGSLDNQAAIIPQVNHQEESADTRLMKTGLGRETGRAVRNSVTGCKSETYGQATKDWRSSEGLPVLMVTRSREYQLAGANFVVAAVGERGR